MAKRRKKLTAAAKKKSPRAKVCFVSMPFGGWLDDYYQTVYCPAIIASGLETHRADDLFRPSTIVNDIWAYTKQAKVLLADLTGKNPNVFYELGLAHALAKPAILVAETMEDIPFDLRSLRVILYDKNAQDWGQILRKKIENSLKEVIAAPAEAVLPAFLDVKSAGAKPTVSTEQRDVIEIKQELDLLRRELRSRDAESQEDLKRRDIGPQQARRVIRDFVQHGAPDQFIVERLTNLGPPEDWIRREIGVTRDELKSRKRARASRTLRSPRHESKSKRGAK